MNLFGLLQNQPPKEVIKAACDFYGVPVRKISTIHAEKLKALSNNLWLVDLDNHAQAVVAYAPGDKAIVAPWYE
jgi:hypothetical protein